MLLGIIGWKTFAGWVAFGFALIAYTMLLKHVPKNDLLNSRAPHQGSHARLPENLATATLKIRAGKLKTDATRDLTRRLLSQNGYGCFP